MQSATMLVIKPRSAEGSGIFDVIVRAANSALAKKVIKSAVNKAANSTVAKKVINSGVAKKVLDSAVGKTLAENITKENFKKAANSAIGRQLTKAVADKVDDVFEKATKAGLEKLQFTTASEKAPEEKLQFTTASEKAPGKKRVPPGTKRRYTENSFARKKGKRRKTGKGIIYQ